MRIVFTIFLFIMVTACSSTTPIAITNNVFDGKIGRSCQWTGPILSLFSKKISIEIAKQNGNITKASSLEMEKTQYPLYFVYTCIVVSGS